jgi:hypothetical protein
MDGQNRDSGATSSGQNEFQPNQVVSPNVSQPAQPAQTPQNPNPPSLPTANGELPEPAPSSEPTGPDDQGQENDEPDEPAQGRVVTGLGGDTAEPPANADGDQAHTQHHAHADSELKWNASEFVAHPKTPKWYAGLAAVTIVAVALGYFITKDWITVVVLIISAGLFGYMGSRQPRELDYGLSNSGVTVGQKFYPLSDFKSFTIIDEGTYPCIDFMPLKRFGTVLTVYYDPKLEDRILDILSDRLPFSKHERTMTDNFMHRIRF